MWPKTPLTDLLGIEVPIIQAPMAGVSTPALAAAVSNAGGLGSLGLAFHTPEAFRDAMAETRQATNRPVNANFFVHDPPHRDPAREERFMKLLDPYYEELGIAERPALAAPMEPFGEAMLEAVLEAGLAVVSFHYGLPKPAHLAAVKRSGAVVLSSATTVSEAKILAEQGADAIVAQGFEAGGHRGTFAVAHEAAQVGTMALVPQIVDAVDVPVIAAGGIADGRGIAAALTLGAGAAQMGTAFISCPESAARDAYRAALRDLSDDGTRLSPAVSGRPARWMLNRYVAEMAKHPDSIPDYPLPSSQTGPLTAASIERGAGDYANMLAGQAAALNRELPAAELLEVLISETEAALAGRTAT